MQCPPGESLVLDDAGTGAACAPDAECECVGTAAVGISGEPTGYLRAVPLRSGEVGLFAYDLALRDLTWRIYRPGADRADPWTYIDGFDGEAGLPAHERARLGRGADRGAELSATSRGDTLAAVYRDRPDGGLRMAIGDGEVWHRFAFAPAGRWPALSYTDEGWIVVWQEHGALRAAASDGFAIESAQDFTIATLGAGPPENDGEPPSGYGAQPAIAQLRGRWFVASYGDGALILTGFDSIDDQPTTDILVAPKPGLTTGLAPRIVPREPDGLEVFYLDGPSGGLRVITVTVSGAGRLIGSEVTEIDRGLDGHPARSIGYDLHAARDPAGRLVVAYQDASNANLMVARNAGGTWSVAAVDTGPGAGFFPQLFWATDAGTLAYGRWRFPDVGQVEQELVLRAWR